MSIEQAQQDPNHNYEDNQKHNKENGDTPDSDQDLDQNEAQDPQSIEEDDPQINPENDEYDENDENEKVSGDEIDREEEEDEDEDEDDDDEESDEEVAPEESDAKLTEETEVPVIAEEAEEADLAAEAEPETEVEVEASGQANKPKTKRKKKNGKGGYAEPQKPATIVHMVFDQTGGQQIKQSFELDPEIAGEIVFIEDNYSLGPVADLQEAEGWQARKQWWQSVLGLPEDEQPEVMASDKMKMHQLLQQLEDEDTALWIWMGQNERDVAGYFHVISQLMTFQGRIHVLYLNNLPFIDEKGHIFYPRQLSEILPKEFVKASRLARVVTLSEFELDPEEWDKLSRQPGAVRLLEGGKKLSLRENDYYDKIILDQLGTAAMKLPRLLSQLVTKAKLGLPEYYIVWRIKSLIESGQIVSQGDFEKGIKNVSLKATQGQMFVELDPDETTGEPETESGD